MSAAADSARAAAASATAVGAATNSASAAANNTTAAAAAHTGVKHVRGGVHLAGVMVIVIVVVVIVIIIVVVIVVVIVIIIIVIIIVIVIVIVVCGAVAGVTPMGAVRRLGVMTVTGADSSIDIGVARGQGGGERGGNETRQQKDKGANTNHDEWND